MNNVVNEWLKSHRLSGGWKVVGGQIQKTGLPVILLYNKSDKTPYSVQYAGSGNYFKTRSKAEEYIYGRGWDWRVDVTPGELADRLDECWSYVTKDGDWEYDRVPSDLVQDLLAYLRNHE